MTTAVMMLVLGAVWLVALRWVVYELPLGERAARVGCAVIVGASAGPLLPLEWIVVGSVWAVVVASQADRRGDAPMARQVRR